MKIARIATMAAMLSLLGPFSVSAQLHMDPGGDGCEDDSTSGQCYRCTKDLIGFDSSGEAVYEYDCTPVDPSPLFNSSKSCTAGSNGCSQSDWCVIA